MAVSKNEMSMHKAALKYNVPNSTLHDTITRQKTRRRPIKLGCKCTLTAEEENVVVYLLLFFSDCGISLTRTHVQDAPKMFVETLLCTYREKLSFVNNRSSSRFLKRFRERHHALLKYAMPSCYEGSEMGDS